jgi:hypothetical protein
LREGIVLTTIATVIGYVVLFGLAALGLAVLIGVINNVTIGRGKPQGPVT